MPVVAPTTFGSPSGRQPKFTAASAMGVVRAAPRTAPVSATDR
jgi:hypothetical protein